MKKIIITILATLTALMMTACGGAAPAPAATGPLAGAPEWVIDPEIQGGIAAVGIAPTSPGGMSFQKTEAMADARDALAKQLSIKVNNMVKKYQSQTGVGDSISFEKMASNVSKQVASQTLSGSKRKGLWMSGNGDLYVYVVLNPNEVKSATKSAMNNAVKTSYKNDEALYQEFKAKKSQDALDTEIEKMLN